MRSYFGKKFFFSAATFLFFLTTLSSEIVPLRFRLTEPQDDFKIEFLPAKEMQEAENLMNDDLSVYKTYKITRDGLEAELRYTLFTDCGGNSSDFFMQYKMLLLMTLYNIAGYEVPEKSISSHKPGDVKAEFNGTTGQVIFIRDPCSQYSSGYKYIMAEFFYKAGQGAVLRTFLFNDTAFLGLKDDGTMAPASLWLSVYHTFRFF